MGYDNLYNKLKIKSITGKKIILEDGSEWESVTGTDPSGWAPGNTVSVEPATGKIKSEAMFRIKMFIDKKAPVKTQKATDVLATLMTQPVKKSAETVRGRPRTESPILDQKLKMVKCHRPGLIELEDGWCYQLSELGPKISGQYSGDHLMVKVQAINPKTKSYSIQIEGAPNPVFATLIRD